MYGKPVSDVSEIVTMAGTEQRQSKSAMEKGVKASQERRHKVRKGRKKASSRHVEKAKVQTTVEQQSATFNQECWNGARDGSTHENAEFLSQPTSVQTGSQRPENTRSSEAISLTRTSSTNLHHQVPVTHPRRTQDDDEAATSSADCSKKKTTARAGRQGALECESKSARNQLKRDLSLYPYLETQQAVTPQYSSHSVANSLERARQKLSLIHI